MGVVVQLFTKTNPPTLTRKVVVDPNGTPIKHTCGYCGVPVTRVHTGDDKGLCVLADGQWCSPECMGRDLFD